MFLLALLQLSLLFATSLCCLLSLLPGSLPVVAHVRAWEYSVIVIVVCGYCCCVVISIKRGVKRNMIEQLTIR